MERRPEAQRSVTTASLAGHVNPVFFIKPPTQVIDAVRGPFAPLIAQPFIRSSYEVEKPTQAAPVRDPRASRNRHHRPRWAPS